MTHSPVDGAHCRAYKGFVPASASLVLMGALEFQSSGVTVPLPPSAQRLLAFMGLRRGPLSRLYVAGQLWLDSTEERASGCLRSALWRLNRAAGEVVSATGRGLELAPGIDVDLDRADAAVGEVLAGTGPVRPEVVAELCGSRDVLPDWYEEWAEPERERFRQVRLHALERLCGRLTAEGRFAEALEAGLAALRADPLRESAHRAMIGMHLAEGNVGEAVRQYDSCRRLMTSQLGVPPSGRLERLIEDGVRVRRRGSTGANRRHRVGRGAGARRAAVRAARRRRASVRQ
jgi:DNA-binding SARP family transcriptional activator